MVHRQQTNKQTNQTNKQTLKPKQTDDRSIDRSIFFSRSISVFSTIDRSIARSLFFFFLIIIIIIIIIICCCCCCFCPDTLFCRTNPPSPFRSFRHVLDILLLQKYVLSSPRPNLNFLCLSSFCASLILPIHADSCIFFSSREIHCN